MKKCKITKLIGWVLLVFTAALLAVPAVSKLIPTQEMVGNFEFMHLSPYMKIVGIVELIGLILLAIPKTSAYGAVLIGSVMSAAVVMHISLMGGQNVSYPLLVGLLAWGSYVLRSKKILCNPTSCCQSIKNETSHL